MNRQFTTYLMYNNKHTYKNVQTQSEVNKCKLKQNIVLFKNRIDRELRELTWSRDKFGAAQLMGARVVQPFWRVALAVCFKGSRSPVILTVMFLGKKYESESCSHKDV